jgi:hypothetical protein
MWSRLQIGGTQDQLMPFYIGYNKVQMNCGSIYTGT